MARKGLKKDTYWHKTAELCLAHNFKPAQVAKVIKDIFPLSNVNGRHIGAYKRRLAEEGEIEIPVRPATTLQEMMSMVNGLVTDEDWFSYTCSIGSTKRSLKCFEYKLTAELEDKDDMENIDGWISTLRK